MAYLIEEGSEPLTFTNVFPSWDRASKQVSKTYLRSVGSLLLYELFIFGSGCGPEEADVGAGRTGGAQPDSV